MNLRNSIDEQKGGLTFLNGKYTIFTSSELLEKVKIYFVKNGNAPSTKIINEKLNAGGFRVKHGSNIIEFIMDEGIFTSGKLNSKLSKTFTHYGKKSLANIGIGSAVVLSLAGSYMAAKAFGNTSQPYINNNSNNTDTFDTVAIKYDNYIKKINSEYAKFNEEYKAKNKNVTMTLEEYKANNNNLTMTPKTIILPENYNGTDKECEDIKQQSKLIPKTITLPENYNGTDEENILILNILNKLGDSDSYKIDVAIVIEFNNLFKNKFISEKKLVNPV
jgi:hypothetical protein